MPVLQVFAGPAADVRVRLDHMCRVVAEELDLPADGVIATYVPVAETVVGGAGDASWPVVVIHGSQRDPDAMERARTRVALLAAGWGDRPEQESWVTWMVQS